MEPKALVFNIQKFSLNDGDGIRTVVFFKGCPLRCRWCSNPESQAAENTGILDGEWKSIREIVSICLQDRDFYEESGGGVTLSGGEATLQSEACLALLKALKAEEIHTALETTGFCRKEVFDEIISYADLLLFDIKHYDEKKHLEGTGVSNFLCFENMKRAIRSGKRVIPRLPVIPGFNNSPADADGFCAKLKEAGAKEVQLLPFHQFGESKYEKLGKEYHYKDVPALHPEDLKDFIEEFGRNGITATI